MCTTPSFKYEITISNLVAIRISGFDIENMQKDT